MDGVEWPVVPLKGIWGTQRNSIAVFGEASGHKRTEGQALGDGMILRQQQKDKEGLGSVLCGTGFSQEPCNI